MKHQYLMNISPDDWNDLTIIRNLTDTPFSQLIREGVRHIVKSKKDNISQVRKMRETLSHMNPL
jgi:hypothetical protein